MITGQIFQKTILASLQAQTKEGIQELLNTQSQEDGKQILRSIVSKIHHNNLNNTIELANLAQAKSSGDNSTVVQFSSLVDSLSEKNILEGYEANFIKEVFNNIKTKDINKKTQALDKLGKKVKQISNNITQKLNMDEMNPLANSIVDRDELGKYSKQIIIGNKGTDKGEEFSITGDNKGKINFGYLSINDDSITSTQEIQGGTTPLTRLEEDPNTKVQHKRIQKFALEGKGISEEHAKIHYGSNGSMILENLSNNGFQIKKAGQKDYISHKDSRLIRLEEGDSFIIVANQKKEDGKLYQEEYTFNINKGKLEVLFEGGLEKKEYEIDKKDSFFRETNANGKSNLVKGSVAVLVLGFISFIADTLGLWNHFSEPNNEVKQEQTISAKENPQEGKKANAPIMGNGAEPKPETLEELLGKVNTLDSISQNAAADLLLKILNAAGIEGYTKEELMNKSQSRELYGSVGQLLGNSKIANNEEMKNKLLEFARKLISKNAKYDSANNAIKKIEEIISQNTIEESDKYNILVHLDELQTSLGIKNIESSNIAQGHDLETFRRAVKMKLPKFPDAPKENDQVEKLKIRINKFLEVLVDIFEDYKFDY